MAAMCRVTGRVTDSAGRGVPRLVFVPVAVNGVADARREIAVRTNDGAVDVRLAPGQYTLHAGRSRYLVTVPEQALANIGAIIDAAREGGHGTRNR